MRRINPKWFAVQLVRQDELKEKFYCTICGCICERLEVLNSKPCGCVNPNKLKHFKDILLILPAQELAA